MYVCTTSTPMVVPAATSGTPSQSTEGAPIARTRPGARVRDSPPAWQGAAARSAARTRSGPCPGAWARAAGRTRPRSRGTRSGRSVGRTRRCRSSGPASTRRRRRGSRRTARRGSSAVWAASEIRKVAFRTRSAFRRSVISRTKTTATGDRPSWTRRKLISQGKRVPSFFLLIVSRINRPWVAIFSPMRWRRVRTSAGTRSRTLSFSNSARLYP